RLAIEVGPGLLEGITEGIEGINNLIDAFHRLDPDTQKRLVDVALALGGVVLAAKALAVAWAFLEGPGKVVIGALKGIAAAAGLISGPVLAVIAAIGAVGVAGVKFYQFQQQFSEGAKASQASIKELGDELNLLAQREGLDPEIVRDTEADFNRLNEAVLRQRDLIESLGRDMTLRTVNDAEFEERIAAIRAVTPEITALGNAYRGAVEEQQRLAEGTPAATAALDQHAQAAKNAALTLEEFQANQRDLREAAVQGAEDLIREEGRRDKALEKLRADHNKAIGRLNQERVDVEAENQDRLDQLAERNRLRDERAAEDRGVADARDEREWQEQQAADLEAYQEQRADLISTFQKQQIKDEEEYQRELSRAQRAGQLDQYRTQVDFLEDLYDRTRGRRNKAGLESGVAALRAAQQEAAVLAQTDPVAAAALFSERLRQAEEAQLVERENRQLRRDAKRGGGLTSGDVEAEIATLAEVRTTANQLAIDAILTGAKERREDRERIKGEQADAHREQLAELDSSFNERRQEEAEQRRQLLADRDADRRLDAQRRAEDDAAALADLVQSNKERLAAVDEQITAENTKYDDAHKQVLSDFETFKAELLGKIEDAKKALLMTPTEQERAALLDAAKVLGAAFGDAYVAEIVARIEAATPEALVPRVRGNTPGSLSDRVRDGSTPAIDPTQRAGAQRGGSVVAGDPVLSPRAIDQVVLGGVQTDSFNAIRNGNLHAGIDLRVPEGTPVKSLSDGYVTVVGQHPEWGRYMVVAAPDGSQWYYGHLSKVIAGQEQGVKRGQLIARSGSTGRVTGPHLHLQLRRGGHAIDPSSVLEQLAGPSLQAQGSAGLAGGDYRTQAALQGGAQLAYNPTQQAILQGGRPSPLDQIGTRNELEMRRILGASEGTPYALGPLDRPSLLDQPVNTSTVYSPEIHVHIDARGATDVDLGKIRAEGYRGAKMALDEYEADRRTAVAQFKTRGTRR
ncbi:MAG TPA: peptidoglycan DD-metalloendopeptidase family protein, partial [Herpetosiphonaceae bacterium]|nr:peptidoglycan DD-metalloendopeptidase family protein [Herpetosiphonaceae bacterium]